MITLYTFSPVAGLPDASPFVMKAMTLLKMAGLDYETDRNGFARAPKRKLPYLNDGGEIIADSTFIRFHIEKAHGFDFDAHLTNEQKALAWAIEKMCEDHLYWVVIHTRWYDDANFERSAARLFQKVPAFARPFVQWSVRRKVKSNAYAQGMGRHSAREVNELGIRDIEALSTILGDKPYLFGDHPCGADATVFAFIAAVLTPLVESPIRDAALETPNLVAYRDRMMAAYFPDDAD